MDCRAQSHDLVEVIENLGTPQLLVVGDLILDRYTWGDAERVSQEAPVIMPALSIGRGVQRVRR